MVDEVVVSIYKIFVFKIRASVIRGPFALWINIDILRSKYYHIQ